MRYLRPCVNYTSPGYADTHEKALRDFVARDPHNSGNRAGYAKAGGFTAVMGDLGGEWRREEMKGSSQKGESLDMNFPIML